MTEEHRPKEPETMWDCMWFHEREQLAERLGLIRISSFPRRLPCWHEIPDSWKPKISEALT